MGPRRGLGEVLKRIREKRGLTQADLAAAAGVTREYITMLETGSRSNPSIDILKQLAKALKVRVGKLLE